MKEDKQFLLESDNDGAEAKKVVPRPLSRSAEIFWLRDGMCFFRKKSQKFVET